MPSEFAGAGARVVAALLGMVLVQVGCSGGGGGAGKPAQGAQGSAASAGAGAAGGEGAAGEGPGGEGTPPPACSDEGCFPCGEGACPRGFYCDTGAAGGAACSWAPECGGAQDCACLGRVLTGCTCEAKGGGAQVSCRD